MRTSPIWTGRILAGGKRALGDIAGAKADWWSAYRANPRILDSLICLTDSCIEAGDFKGAREGCNELLRATRAGVEWAELCAKLADAAGEPGGALGALDLLTRDLPTAVGPRLALCRRLVPTPHAPAAVPHLDLLARQGVAEAAFLLANVLLNAGDVAAAWHFAERAKQLAPNHGQTLALHAKLEAIVDIPIPSVLSPAEQRKLLRGKHVSRLGYGTKRCSIVIVAYNSAAHIGPCLESILPTLTDEDEIFIVDNASTDETVPVARSYNDPRIVVIGNKTNVGYARAANIGLLKTAGKNLVLLNPDTIVYSGWLEKLASRLTEGVGAVGPVSDNITGLQNMFCYLRPGARVLRPDLPAVVETPSSPPAPADGESAIEPADLPPIFAEENAGKTIQTKLLVGMCLMVPRPVFEAFGLLDDNMVLGADDLELSWRLRTLGMKLVIALDTFVRHTGRASFSKRPAEEVASLIAESDAALVAKLRRYYGPNPPSSMRLWGNPIFDDALGRVST